MAVHPAMGLVIGGVLLFIGIYTVTQVLSSTALPTTATTVTAESHTVTNATADDFDNQATCLDDYPLPTNCGVIATTGVAAVYNSSGTSLPTSDCGSGLACYTWTTSDITIITNSTYPGLTWSVNYTYYDYHSSGASTAWPSTQTTVWNSIQLASVSLITVAASLVLGSFFFK